MAHPKAHENLAYSKWLRASARSFAQFSLIDRAEARSHLYLFALFSGQISKTHYLLMVNSAFSLDTLPELFVTITV